MGARCVKGHAKAPTRSGSSSGQAGQKVVQRVRLEGNLGGGMGSPACWAFEGFDQVGSVATQV